MSLIDQQIFDFFVANRFYWLNFLVIAITYMGSYVMIGGLTLLSAISFYFHRHALRIIPLFVAVGGSAVTVYVLKHLFFVARPEGAFYIETNSAFPSGHATMAMALYGFFIYTIWSHDRHHLKNPFIIFLAALILLVGASRLYLGVHHLSDVLAGYAIGLLWILIARLISKSKFLPPRDGGRL